VKLDVSKRTGLNKEEEGEFTEDPLASRTQHSEHGLNDVLVLAPHPMHWVRSRIETKFRQQNAPPQNSVIGLTVGDERFKQKFPSGLNLCCAGGQHQSEQTDIRSQYEPLDSV
jgi:hypothetical protein